MQLEQRHYTLSVFLKWQLGNHEKMQYNTLWSVQELQTENKQGRQEFQRDWVARIHMEKYQNDGVVARIHMEKYKNGTANCTILLQD
jgi:hypothetical protein